MINYKGRIHVVVKYVFPCEYDQFLDLLLSIFQFRCFQSVL